ncbi:bifunctional phosphopantothenoylcysteine decarboxylase/phosphopantothenate--cysteine ligase CoaBC [Gracilimonas mengyeensis]|uniref:Coenzyme A biosynthesis bifunctional protein CoaBC n=1 Tax=Gracilimonas mengyeensis TaxID=1302730 RepID=A0A521BFW3_9BACT|nr:bifunctional phosphopantothenoylcysteine decarboxylase/phosphopantothenate--cysteine ligase CoaBC [Gracilimonas mengyeensis]SMO45962.1 phosphopantothenoylcysteine decarboxylase / phosphopantothenate--cysteine ligase [Gracilimonas mengyeensis]
MLSGKRIILGVTGGIAAYKAVVLLREFQKAGAEVRVTMTPSATRFVGLETFASLSGYDVAVDIFPDDADSSEWTRHINWGEWADLFVIAPCTANTLAKIAHGISDNMLTSTVLAARCPLLICPTMDGEMYESPGVAENLKNLQKKDYYLLEPESGYLASGLEGKGRLPEMDAILERASEIIGSVKGPLEGKKVVVTAGPTREHIDPVRFISNPSSGKMGIAMAKAAQSLGADVTLIHGPLSVEKPDDMHSVSITSTADLFEAVKEYSDADVIIMAAAVSDFTPAETFTHKVKKDDAGDAILLKRTQDILAWLGENKKEGQVLIGFAMETENLVENATSKLKKKNADYIIANALTEEDAGFATDTNRVLLLSKDGEQQFEGTKTDIAIEVLNTIFR